MRPRIPVLLSLVAALAVPVLAGPALAEDAPDARPHTDAQVAPALAQFEKDFASEDIHDRLKAVRTIGRWRHKKVVKALTRILQKEDDLELKAAAAGGLGHQVPFAKEVGRTLAKALDDWKKWATREDPEGDEKVRNEDEARVLAAAVTAIGDLGYRDAWEVLEEYVDHPHDGPAAATMTVCGKLKEWRAIPRILEWFNFYPDGLSWSGGSASVDTGAEGNADQKAAEAKWKRTFGSRARKARPAVFEVMQQALKDITGVHFDKPEELKAWMEENEALLKKNGV